MRQEDSSAIILQKFAQALKSKLREKRGLLQAILQNVAQALEEVRERGMQEV